MESIDYAQRSDNTFYRDEFTPMSKKVFKK